MVKVRNLIIGEGIPKICVPIVGKTKEDIINEAETFHEKPLDMVEWRGDWFNDIFDFDKVKEVIASLRETLGDIPILFTFRTSNEGGEKSIEWGDYIRLNQQVAGTGLVDLVDVEIFSGDDVVKQVIEAAHNCGVKVIASNHDFYSTPPKEEIVRRLCKMKDLSADIPKIAVTPACKRDVLTLLEATLEMKEKYPECSIITMSMKGEGVISRLAGEVFGSALTFGAANKASAPGQIKVDDLNKILQLLHQFNEPGFH